MGVGAKIEKKDRGGFGESCMVTDIKYTPTLGAGAYFEEETMEGCGD